MPVLENLPLDLDPVQVARDLKRGREDARLAEATSALLPKALELARPRAVYVLAEVVEVVGEQAVLRNGEGRPVTLTLGPRAELLAPARKAQVAVSTIGPALGEEVKRLNQAGDYYQGYLLDSLGVALLGEVGNAVCRQAERTAAELGFGVGLRLSPGSLVGWDHTDQYDLCSLLPLGEIEVTLNDHGVLVPHKSASGLIGLGPGYRAKRVGSACRYCPRRETCWRRQESL